MKFCVPTWAWGSHLPKDQHLPVTEALHRVAALGVSYADAIVLLKEMCDKGAVAAEFRAGPMPNFGLNIKK